LFQHAVHTYADRQAFGVLKGKDWAWTTYAELDQLVTQCRAGLALLGVGRGDRVGVIADNRLEWVIAAHATFQRRAIYVPMFEAQVDSELKYILADSGVKVCIVANSSVAARVAALREDLLDLAHVVNMEGPLDDPGSFSHLLARGAERAITGRTPSPTDVATIIYTSGTTGEPKGVRLTHGNLASNTAALSEMRDYGPDPRTMAFLPWAHVFGGCVELNLAFALGASVAICKNADQLFEEMPRVRPTTLYAVPRIWQQIYHDIQRELAKEADMGRNMFDQGLRLRAKQQKGEKLSLSEKMLLNLSDKLVIGKLKAQLGGRLKLAFSGAAPLPQEVAEFLHAIGVTIHEGYGLTESSGSTTTNPAGAVRFGSVGKPVPGTTIKIDRGANPTEGVREGEILVYGPGVMAGYHNRPEDTAAALTGDGGLRTGDLGFLDDDGYLYITGRVKELYKLNNGRYVAPVPLEEKLKLSPFISNCMVYGSGQPYNVALIVADVPALQAYFGGDVRPMQDLLTDRRTRRLFEEEILKHSRDFRTFELVRNFWLEMEPFTRENGMLTPTFKLRRDLACRRYEGKLLSLYG
ncbi:MAG TPA: long-chain fatty acid--CoA ligase, partial [Polyangiales bacterium]|nr:long-chain fatty acid--CoA ligase [Polyangiales bacterium]